MGNRNNVNVRFNRRLNNVNVQRREERQRSANQRVIELMRRLGPESEKDEKFWYKVVTNLSENQVAIGLEIATQKKPKGGMPRIRYVSGIYANMMASYGKRGN